MIPKLLNHPGEFILIQCIVQLVLDVHWLEIIQSFWEFLLEHPDICKWMAILDILASSFSMNYMLCLSIEVNIKLYKFSHSFDRFRKYTYHVFSIGQGVFLVLLAQFNGDFGNSTIGTCSLFPTSLTETIRVYTFGLETILMWVLIFGMIGKVGKTYSNVIFNYFLVILAMTLSVSIVNILGYANEFGVKNPEVYSDWALMIGSTTGISMGLSRLANKRLIKQILWKIGIKSENKIMNSRSAQSISESITSNNIYNFGDLFENEANKYYIKMLSVIYLRFTVTDHKKLSVENEGLFDQYEYDEMLFDDLSAYYDIPRIKESKRYKVYHPDLLLIEYEPELFKRLRIENSIEDEKIYESFCLPDNLNKIKQLKKAKGGRSGSTVFFTFNQEFVIKILNGSEKKLLIKILPKYIERVSNKNSRLSRIIGLFKIKPGEDYFIIMENILSSQKDAVIFDLKGSSVDRFVETDFSDGLPYGHVFKDRNLEVSGLNLNLNDRQKNEIIESLKLDFELLNEFNIMDYSVILGFYKLNCVPITRYDVQGNDRVYGIGIIDFLQSFNAKKKYEKYFKKLIHRKKQISAEVPSFYKNRLCRSMSEIFQSSY